MLKTSRGLILTINWLFPIKLVPVRTKGTLGESICAKVVIVKFLSAELTIGNFLFVTKEKVSSPRAPADNFSNPDKKEEFQIIVFSELLKNPFSTLRLPKSTARLSIFKVMTTGPIATSVVFRYFNL